ncbi:MAG: response regulator [Nitrospirae bacterium]|nr:response regulator [Nitrospirota bacterium]
MSAQINKDRIDANTIPLSSILVVDDEKEFIQTLLKRLRRRGLQCEGVFSGEEAISKISAREFDVVLLDMKLPDMDGNSTLVEIKKIRPATRVIILTGHASVNEGLEGIKNGALDYLMKPVEFESLFEKLLTAAGITSCSQSSHVIDTRK